MREPIQKIIFSAVLRVTGVNEMEIKMRTRQQRIVRARHIFAYMMTKWSNITLSEIGVIIGHRDHSTVIHSRKFCMDAYDINDPMTKDIDMVDEIVRGRMTSGIHAPSAKEIYITINPLLT